MPEQFTDGNIGAHGSPISPADRDITDASLSNLSAVGQQGAIDSGAYSSNHPSGMVGATPQDEIRYRQEHEPYNYQPDGDQFVYITKAYLYEIHPLTTELIKKHELSPLKIKLDTKKGCVYSQFMTDQQGKLLDDYILLKTEEDDPPESTPFELLDGDGTEDTEKYGIYNVLLFKFANGVILRNNYDSDKDDPRSVRDHGGIEGHRGPLIWSCGYNTLNNLGLGEGLIYKDYTKSDDKKNLRTLKKQGQINIATAGDQINIRGNSNDKTWQAIPDDDVSYSNTTLATFADGLLTTPLPTDLKVVQVAKATGSGTTVNSVTSSPSITSTPEALSVSSITPPSGSGLALDTYEYTPTAVSTEALTQVSGSVSGGTGIDLQSVSVTSSSITPPSGSGLVLDTKEYTPTPVSTETLSQATNSVSGGTDISFQAVSLDTQQITPPDGTSLDLQTKQYASVELSTETVSIDATALHGGDNLTTTPTPLSSTSVPVQSTGTKSYTSRALTPHTLTATAGLASGTDVNLQSVPLTPTTIKVPSNSGITLTRKEYTPTTVATETTSVTSSFTGGNNLVTTPTDLDTTPSTVLEFDTKKYTSRTLLREELAKKPNTLSKSGSTAEVSLETVPLSTTSITPPSGSGISLDTKTYTSRALGNETLTKEATALKGGVDLDTDTTELHSTEAPVLSAPLKTYTARELSKTTLSPQLLALKGGSDLTCNPTDLNTETLEAPALPVKTFTTTELGTISLSKQSDALTGGTDYTCTPTTMTTKSFSRVEESFNENLQQQSGALEGGSDYTCTPTAMTTKSFTTQANTWYGGETLTLEWKQVSAYTDNSTIWVLTPTSTPSDTSSSLSAIVGAQQYTAIKRASGNTGTTFHLYQSGTSAVTGNNKVLTTDSSSTAAVTLRKDIGTYTGVKNLSNANVYLYSTTGASDTRVYIKPPTTSPVEDNHYLYFSTDSVTASKVLTTDSTTETSVVIRNGATEYTGVTGISSSSGILFYTAASTGKQFLEADSADNNNDTTKVYCTDSGSTRNFLSHTGNPTKVTYHVYTDADSVSGQKVLKTDSDNTEEVLRTGITPFTATKGISSAVTLYEAPASSESSSDTFLETTEDSGNINYVYSSTESTTRKLLSSETSASSLHLYSSATPDSTTKFLKVGASESGEKKLRVGAVVHDGITGLAGLSSAAFYKADGTSHKFLETTESNGQQRHIYFSDATDSRTFITSSGSPIKVVTSVNDFSTTNYVKTNDNWSGEKEFMHTIDTHDGVTGLSANTVKVYKENTDSSHTFLDTEESGDTDYHIYATTSAATDTRFLTTGLSSSSLNLYFSDAPTQSKYLKTTSSNSSETLRSGMADFDAVSGIADGSMLYKAPTSGETKFLKTGDSAPTHNVYVSNATDDMTFLTSLGSDIGILTSDTISGVSAVNYVKSNDSSLASAKQFKHTFQGYTGLSSNDDENVSVYEVPPTTTNRFLETTETAGNSHRVYSTDTSTTSTRFLSPSGTDTSLHLYSTGTADSTTKFLKVANSVQGDKILKSGMSVFNAVTGLTSGAKLYEAGSATNHNFLQPSTATGTHHVYFSDASTTKSFITSSGSPIHVVKAGSSLGSTKFVKTTGTGIDSAKTFKHTLGSYTGVTGLSGSNIHLYSTATADNTKFVKTTDTGASHVYVSGADTQRTFITSVGSAVNVLTASSMSDGSSAKFVKTTGTNVDGIDSAKTFKHTLGSYTGITGLSAASGIRLYSTDTADTAKFVKTTDTGARHVYISTADNQRTFITSTGSSINVLTKSGTGGINVFTTGNTTDQTLITAVDTTPSTLQTVSGSEFVLKAP